jgi:hypothetical protein
MANLPPNITKWLANNHVDVLMSFKVPAPNSFTLSPIIKGSLIFGAVGGVIGGIIGAMKMLAGRTK